MKLIAALVKWISIPVLLVASLFSQLAGEYQFPAEILCCVVAAGLGAHAVREGDYLWASGLGIVAIVFSPLPLVNKLFCLMAYIAICTVITLWAAWRAGRTLRQQDGNEEFDDSLSLTGIQAIAHPVVRSANQEDTCHLESISSGF